MTNTTTNKLKAERKIKLNNDKQFIQNRNF